MENRKAYHSNFGNTPTFRSAQQGTDAAAGAVTYPLAHENGGSMVEVDAIIRRLNANADIAAIRRDVAKLIAAKLESIRDNLGYWEKSCFIYAIATLRSNLATAHQPTQFWLYACLNELELAFVPKDKRNENYTRQQPQIDALTFDQLDAELEDVCRRYLA